LFFKLFINLKNILYFLITLNFLFSLKMINGEEINHQIIFDKPAICDERDRCILLEIATNENERRLGLMFRKELDQDKGMLFDYGSPKYVNIWMLNTFIPLDIIFINNGIIVKIVEGAKPCLNEPCELYNSFYPVNKVLEINSGKSKKMHFSVGQKLYLRNFKN